MKVGPWTTIEDGAACRTRAATPNDLVEHRMAVIEKTPRVRIRPDRYRHRNGGEDWAEHLDWAEGPKGYGPDDPNSRAWCDRVLIALGHDLVDI